MSLKKNAEREGGGKKERRQWVKIEIEVEEKAREAKAVKRRRGRNEEYKMISMS